MAVHEGRGVVEADRSRSGIINDDYDEESRKK